MTFAANALFGKTILVTGGSSGLGRAAAEGIAACGGRVALAGRDEGRLGTVRASLAGSGHSLVVGRLDTIEEAAGLVSRVAEDCGGLDGIFHSAGCYELVPARMVSTRHVETVMGAALMGGLGIAKAAGSTGVMRPGASIVMMSSVAARRGRACVAVYSAAKAGIEGLIRSLAKEFVPRSVRVNAVAAGAVKTPLLDRGHKMLPDASAKAIEAAHPLGIGEPSDVANAVLFLLSDASRWMTGTVLDVDGGYLGS